MNETYDSTSSTVLVTAVTDWLMLQALGDAEIEDIFEGCCERLDASGVSITRAMVTFRTLHPLYASQLLFWRRGEDVRSTKTRACLGGPTDQSAGLVALQLGDLCQTQWL